MKIFFVLWLYVGAEKFPSKHYESLNECLSAGILETKDRQNQSDFSFQCVKWG